METRRRRTESASSNSVRSSPSKSKNRRPYRPRRPRAFPASLRQKLELFGHLPPSNDTSRENMIYLIDRLSTDLEQFRNAADHWQRKYNELNKSSSSESSPIPITESVEEPYTVSDSSTGPYDETAPIHSSHCSSIEFNESLESNTRPNGDIELILDLQSGKFSNSMELASFGTHLIGRLHNASNPSLSIVNLNTPRLRSNVAHLINDNTFSMVIRGIESQIAVRVGLSDYCKQYALSRWLKPDFSLEKALEVWNHIYAPMDVHPNRLIFSASTSCRIGGLEYDEDDPDVDYFDRVLAKANDEEIVDMLHYCTMMIPGLRELAYDDPNLNGALTHIGKACERLLREAVVSRNTTLNSSIARSLLEGLIASLWHFNSHKMDAASLSVVELSWHICTLHPNTAHPALKLLIAFFGMVLTTSNNKRLVWQERIEEIRRNPANQRSFQVIFVGHFAHIYHGMFTRNQDSVLQSIHAMDEILKDMSSDPHSLDNWDHIAFQAVSSTPASSPQSRPLQTTSNASNQSTLDSSHNEHTLAEPIGLFFDDFRDSTDSWLLPNEATTSVPIPSTSQTQSHQSESDTFSRFIDEFGEPYVLEDNWKMVMQFTLQLVRAEASIVFGDEESCIHWVDEAEKTLCSIPVDYVTQQVSMAPLTNIIKDTCNFPSGKRTVFDEIGRRMTLRDRSRLDVREAFRSASP